ncbi:MAG: hypothetical protein NUV60_01270 [Patescibacteria group bacterium]|nr:hypothetical protein [Patescibacteria group bacterium]
MEADNMRRFLSTAFLAIVLIMSAAGAAPAAHADDTTDLVNALNAQDAAQAADAAAIQSQLSNGLTAAQDQAAVATPTTLPPNPAMGEGFGQIMVWIMSLFAWLVGVAAITLDNAVYYTVVTMGNYVHNLSAVGVTWRILRDIGNIMLIFGFLAVGITTILNVNWYGSGKKMLPMMLVAAVFLNFSLFISEAIVDTGNLFATQFYQQINGGNPAGAKNFDLVSVSNEGISNKIMGQLGLQSLYDVRTNTAVFKAGNSWVIGFLGIILFLITAFVMFSLAFVLISRFVILLFLIILAPIGFAGLAIPQLARRAGQWWDKLFEQTITAPILLLMLYIALAIITDVHFLTGFGVDSSTGGWTGFVANATGTANLTGFASLILSFLVAMGLLLAVVVQSKNLSAFGAGKASQLAGKLTFGLTAAGMRTTAGWGLNSAAQRFRSSKLARVPIVGRSIAGVLDKGAKASFDVRGATSFGGLKAAGIDAGKAQVGGYRKELEEAIKGREEYGKTLQLTSAEKAAQGEEERQKKSAEQMQKDIQNRADREAQDLLNRQKVDIQPFSARVDTQRKALDEARTRGDQQAIAAAQLAFNSALLDSQKKREEQNKEREALKKVHEQLIRVQQEEIAARRKAVGEIKKAPQEGYAKNLEIPVWGWMARNSVAAKKIRDAAGKSKEQKDVETLLDMVKKAVPPAGGGAPAAPAAPKP